MASIGSVIAIISLKSFSVQGMVGFKKIPISASVL